MAAFPIEFTRRFRFPTIKATSSNLAWGWSSALVDPAADVGWADALMAWLAGGRQHWSEVELGLFPATSAASTQLRQARKPRAWRSEATTRDIAILAVTGSFDDFIATRSRNLRRKLKRARRSAQHLGMQSRESVQPTPRELDRVIGTVSRRSWQGSRRVAVYSNRANQEFYRLLASQPGDLELALHYWEDAAGDPSAYMLAVRAGDVLHQIDTGFDPAAAAAAPGLLATFDSLRWATQHGLARIDMGIDADYKDRFSPELQVGTSVVFTRGLASRISRTRA
ncbi:MAG: GNAT family N-acetyltransferase [Candidatus Nanopelagicales bacterium]